jgi:hypothetical protein
MKKRVNISIEKQKAPGLMVHACNLSIWEAEAGGFEFQASFVT